MSSTIRTWGVCCSPGTADKQKQVRQSAMQATPSLRRVGELPCWRVFGVLSRSAARLLGAEDLAAPQGKQRKGNGRTSTTPAAYSRNNRRPAQTKRRGDTDKQLNAMRTRQPPPKKKAPKHAREPRRRQVQKPNNKINATANKRDRQADAISTRPTANTSKGAPAPRRRRGETDEPKKLKREQNQHKQTQLKDSRGSGSGGTGLPSLLRTCRRISVNPLPYRTPEKKTQVPGLNYYESIPKTPNFEAPEVDTEIVTVPNQGFRRHAAAAAFAEGLGFRT